MILKCETHSPVAKSKMVDGTFWSNNGTFFINLIPVFNFYI